VTFRALQRLGREDAFMANAEVVSADADLREDGLRYHALQAEV
jgi:hypothetical protein